MADHNVTGKAGEEHAAAYLIKNGFTILETNWRYRQKEIDIVALQDEFLVFVEVKTRSYDSFGNPVDSVNRDKQKYIIEAANAYIELKKIENEVRFDIVTVIMKNTGISIEHIPDAFYPRARRY